MRALETSRMRRPWPALDGCTRGQQHVARVDVTNCVLKVVFDGLKALYMYSYFVLLDDAGL